MDELTRAQGQLALLRFAGAIAGLMAIIVVSGISYGQNAKEAYDLQERCGKRAADVFGKDFGDRISEIKSGQVIADYENHYNTRLKRCFILERSTTYMHDRAQPPLKILMLIDVNENKLFASFTPLQCDVHGQPCHSEQEWMTLLQKYMEE
jgi:hypothetical protein